MPEITDKSIKQNAITAIIPNGNVKIVTIISPIDVSSSFNISKIDSIIRIVLIFF